MTFFIPSDRQAAPFVSLEQLTIVAESEEDRKNLASLYRALRHGGTVRVCPYGAKPVVFGSSGAEPIER